MWILQGPSTPVVGTVEAYLWRVFQLLGHIEDGMQAVNSYIGNEFNVSDRVSNTQNRETDIPNDSLQNKLHLIGTVTETLDGSKKAGADEDEELDSQNGSLSNAYENSSEIRGHAVSELS